MLYSWCDQQLRRARTRRRRTARGALCTTASCRRQSTATRAKLSWRGGSSTTPRTSALCFDPTRSPTASFLFEEACCVALGCCTTCFFEDRSGASSCLSPMPRYAPVTAIFPNGITAEIPDLLSGAWLKEFFFSSLRFVGSKNKIQKEENRVSGKDTFAACPLPPATPLSGGEEARGDEAAGAPGGSRTAGG